MYSTDYSNGSKICLINIDLFFISNIVNCNHTVN